MLTLEGETVHVLPGPTLSLSLMSLLTMESMESNPGAQYYKVLSYTEKAIISIPTLSMTKVISLSLTALMNRFLN